MGSCLMSETDARGAGEREERDRRGLLVKVNPSGVDADLRVAVIVPCFNEAATIAKVVCDFRRFLPHADIVVVDNASSDGTVQNSLRAGATVLHEAMRGKGNAVRRAFADVDADIYILVDGDDTYSAEHAPRLVQRLVDQRLDMVVACRVEEATGAYRAGHRLGNLLITRCVAWLFGPAFRDLLSGYRTFSRRYVKSFPVHAKGFEIETELSVHALQLRMPVDEMKAPYGARPEGSQSKLNTYRDGLRILRTILGLLKAERPLAFFGAMGALCMGAAVGLAAPLLVAYFQTSLVPRLPTAVLCAGLMMMASISLACGLILDTVTRGRVEAKRLAYLAISPCWRNGSKSI